MTSDGKSGRLSLLNPTGLAGSTAATTCGMITTGSWCGVRIAHAETPAVVQCMMVISMQDYRMTGTVQMGGNGMAEIIVEATGFSFGA